MSGSRPAWLAEVLERSYRGRRVFVTGHNGFVGSWLTYLLVHAGAEVTGFSLAQYPGGISEQLDLNNLCEGITGDIRNIPILQEAIRTRRPEVVFHLAAQPLVLPSFADPIATFATNVMGTANLLEAVRHQPSVGACVVVTSDKCYATASHAHVETDPFGGDDPYSASKGAAEIVTHAYRHSFFRDSGPFVASARAGNIIGGGDWAAHRLVPDSIRAIQQGEPVRLRNPQAIRPWQHVVDAVIGYLRLGDMLTVKGQEFAEGWNFGPHPDSTVSVAELVGTLVSRWRALGGSAMDPVVDLEPAVSEREFLTLLSSKAEAGLGWSPFLDFAAMIEWTAEWYFEAGTPQGARAVTESQVAKILGEQ
ncbi:MAG TPA: CDP-glucose 4,6-dehydratase [Acidimicrobiales bacterium]|nr:CDP-glucose 4,6-dehydratase [Acidimicrobiales bacterium]